MTKTELLAPAGNLESLRAAIAAGADAVYLGASAFSARAQVGFDAATLKEAIDFAHFYGRRVYVAVNTLIKQREWPQLTELLEQLSQLKPDAVLVQDLGVLSQIKESCPSLQVHASTQMAIHNAAGARFLLDAGISRVVAARECSLDVVRSMAETGMEIEVFVHGALCVSVSGQCLLSSQIGGRSGNRGRCAQPCRLPYRYKDAEGALLSMRDLNTLEQLPQLLDAGVSSLKIEGRLKRPEYITEVVSIYREALDLAESSKQLDHQEEYQERLSQIFNRGGFTQGHLFKAEDSALIGQGRVSHEGVSIGHIVSARRHGDVVLANCTLDKALHNGDGLQIRGRTDQEMIYSGPEVMAGSTATLRLRQIPQAGDAVYRLADEQQLAKARMQAEKLPQIPFDAELVLMVDQPAVLRLHHHSGASVEVNGAIPSPAQKQPISEASATSFIGKTGGTPFVLNGLTVSSDAPLFLPAASLNQLRREGLVALEQRIVSSYQTPPARPWTLTGKATPPPPPEGRRLYALVHSLSTYQTLKQAGGCQLIVSPWDYREGKLEELLDRLDATDIIALPPQMKDGVMMEAFHQIQQAGHQMMLTNVSHLALPHKQPFLVGDGIPVWNNRAAKMLHHLGARAICLSPELAQSEIEELDQDLTEWILPVYGRATVMLLNHCPERVSRGLSHNRAGCRFCDQGQGVRGEGLQDRFQANYPLIPVHFPDGCLILMQHHTPRHLLDRAPEMSWLMSFHDESPEEALQIVQTYRISPIQSTDKPSLGRFLGGVL